MARNRSLLSEPTKLRFAALQGAQDRAHPGYFGNLSARECGNFVRFAIQLAQQQMVASTQLQPPTQPWAQVQMATTP